MAAEGFQLRSILLAVPLGVLAAAIAVLGATVSPLLVLAVAGAGVIFTVAYLRPLWMIGLAVLALPLEFKLQQFAFFDLTASKGLFIAAAAGWICSQVVHRRPLIVESPLTVPILALIVVILPGLLIAENKLVVVNTLGTYIVMFCVFQAIVERAEERHVRALMVGLALVGLVLSALAITDTSFQGGTSTTGGADLNRSDAGFGSPNVLAGFLLVTTMPAACMMFVGSTFRRALFAVAAAVGVYALLKTGSRGGFLGLCAGVLAMVTWRPLRRALLVGIVLFAVLTFGGINPLSSYLEQSDIGERINSITTAAESDPRAPVYRGTIELIKQNPLFGVGANDYASAAADNGIVAIGFAPSHAHSAPLTIAADRGLIGLAAFIFFAVVLGRLFMRALARATGDRRAMLTGLMAAFVATAAHNIVDYTLGAVLVGVLMTLAGCAVVLAREVDAELLEEEPQPEGAPVLAPRTASQPGV